VFKVISDRARRTASWAAPAPAITAAYPRSADNLSTAAIDRRCDTLAFGLGKSQNAIIAKLATRHLTAGELARVGRSFGFDESIPFELPIEPSHLDVPGDDLEFARTAAGFWHSTLSPMHGALLAAAIANRGEMPAPMLIDRAVDRAGGRSRRRCRARAASSTRPPRGRSGA
jgi:cell division protein FtsI/penicillin-binding protein 2